MPLLVFLVIAIVCAIACGTCNGPALSDPAGVILSSSCGGDTFYDASKDELDSGYSCRVEVRNLGATGEILVRLLLRCSEGDFRRRQAVVFGAGEIRTLVFQVLEPSIAARDMNWTADCSPRYDGPAVVALGSMAGRDDGNQIPLRNTGSTDLTNAEVTTRFFYAWKEHGRSRLICEERGTRVSQWPLGGIHKPVFHDYGGRIGRDITPLGVSYEVKADQGRSEAGNEAEGRLWAANVRSLAQSSDLTPAQRRFCGKLASEGNCWMDLKRVIERP